MKAISRRRFFASSLALPLLGESPGSVLSRDDDNFLEDLSRRAFTFFWEQSDPQTGLVLDRARTSGQALAGRHLNVASTALTGFYLTALCIAHERRWRDPNQIRERVRSCFRHLDSDQENVRGWYYHFVDRKDGQRAWGCELSTIDSALLLAGVITAQQYFDDDPEIFRLASDIYARVDFPWMLDNRSGLLRMGWLPETGFLRAQWTAYDEEAILYLLGIASPSYGIPSSCWYSFTRDPIQLAGYRFFGHGPLFTHQYSQAWLDLANLRDGPPFRIDYFRNSVAATYGFRALWISLRGMYPSFSENLWGVTPSDSDIGYIIWGSPGSRRDFDGTIVPCAAGGSLMFAPEICLPALQYMRQQFGEYIFGRYGFADSFNPMTRWVDPDVVGIDVGITLLSAENLRTRNVWRWFNRSPDVARAMQYVFQPVRY